MSTHHGGALLALVCARKDVQRALCAGRMPLRALVDVHAPQVNVDARCASAKGERGSSVRGGGLKIYVINLSA